MTAVPVLRAATLSSVCPSLGRVHTIPMKSHPTIEIMFTSVNKNMKRHQPFDSFSEERQWVPRRRAEKGPRSSPSELASRPSVGAWLWVVGQLLWVPSLLKGAETALGSMTSWLIKAFPPLMEGWKLEHCLQWEIRKKINKRTKHFDQLTRSVLVLSQRGEESSLRLAVLEQKLCPPPRGVEEGDMLSPETNT